MEVWKKAGYKTYTYNDKDKTLKFLAKNDEDAELYRKKVKEMNK